MKSVDYSYLDLSPHIKDYCRCCGDLFDTEDGISDHMEDYDDKGFCVYCAEVLFGAMAGGNGEEAPTDPPEVTYRRYPEDRSGAHTVPPPLKTNPAPSAG